MAGQLEAVVWRNVPECFFGDLKVRREELGRYTFAVDEDAATAAERWERILHRLDEIEEAAAGPYRKRLEAEGLKEEQMAKLEAELMMRLEGARERKQLNKGIVQALNQHSTTRRPV